MNFPADTKSKNKQPAKVADAKYESNDSYKMSYGVKFEAPAKCLCSNVDKDQVTIADKILQHSSLIDFKKRNIGGVQTLSDRSAASGTSTFDVPITLSL